MSYDTFQQITRKTNSGIIIVIRMEAMQPNPNGISFYRDVIYS